MHGMTFNGIRKNYVTTLRGKRRPAWAPLTRELVEVSGLPGAHNMGTEVGVRELEITIVIESQSFTELKVMAEDLADWLVTDEPKPLIFDDEPHRVYYAMIDGGMEMDEIVRVGVGLLKFVCPDPYKYNNREHSQTLSKNVISIVRNSGSADTYPLFEARVINPITNLDIVSPHGYMRVGEPKPVDSTKYSPTTAMLNENMSSMTGWDVASTVDNGYVSGTMSTDGNRFFPRTFGTIVQPPNWQGPSMKKSLVEPVKDFKMEAIVELKNTSGLTGMIEIYLLDANNRHVGKIGIEDTMAGKANTHAKAKAGGGNGKWIFGETYDVWKNFKGMLRLQRQDNVWTAYIAVIDAKGKHIHVRGSTGNLKYVDAKREFMDEVAQVQIAFRTFPNNDASPMFVDSLKLWRLNPKPPTGIVSPYIAQAGDLITIDHAANVIFINGEERIDLKDFGASYFPLKKGDNVLEYNPDTDVDMLVRWRERFK